MRRDYIFILDKVNPETEIATIKINETTIPIRIWTCIPKQTIMQVNLQFI